MASDLDTHIWIWQLTGSPRQPERVRRLFEEQTASLYLSPVSIWEAGMLHAKGRISLNVDFPTWVMRAQKALPLKEAPFNLPIALESLRVDLAHKDPADHLIAATAVVLGFLLVTADRRLVESASVPTLEL